MKHLPMKFLTGLLLLCGMLNNSAAGQRAGAGDTVRKAALATVRIITGELNAAGELQGKSAGSGVIISPKGLLVTARHVIFNTAAQRPYTQIWAGLLDPRHEFAPPNRAVPLKLLAEDAAADLALLQIAPRQNVVAEYPHLPLGYSDDLSYGSTLTVIGFPSAGGATATAVRASVVGLDDAQGWIKVEGSLMHGVSGGAAINANGELVGIALKAQADVAVPFFDDDDAPAGVLTLGAVGFLKSAEAVSQFLARYANAAVNQPSTGRAPVQVSGVLREKGTRNPISGAIVAVLAPDTATPRGVVQQHELLAYGKSEAKGAFQLNRRLRPGKYIFKVIHPNFATLIQEFTVTAQAADLEIELARGR